MKVPTVVSLRWVSFTVLAGTLAACSAASDSGGSSGGSGGAGGSGTGGSSGASASGGTGGSAGASAGGSAGAAAGGAAGSTASGGSAGGSGTGGATGSGGSGTGGSGGSTTGLPSLGTLVILGDSISDGGGVPPFYYDLLKADLTAKYGNIAYHKNSKSGSTTDKLVGQINGLPTTLPGPVAVCITSGGNDMKAHIAQVVLGGDAALRATMGNNVKAALDLLLAPGHFGAGVDVHVYEGNIYDASDGQGNFSAGNCAYGSGYPTVPSDTYFANWNAVIQTQASAHAQQYMDMHMYFYNHGYNHPPDWYASDCTHPSQLGHDKLRRFFYQRITGETLP